MDKKELRSAIKEKKKALSRNDIEQMSRRLTEAFLELPEYKSADCLFAYVSINQEVRTFDIITKALTDGKRVALPKVTGDKIVFRYINSFDDCEAGYKNLLQPDDNMPFADNKESRALMLMPGLAFDRTGARVGYGAGHYDRYLSENTGTVFTKIALCFDFQMTDHIDVEEHDIRVDRIISASSDCAEII